MDFEQVSDNGFANEGQIGNLVYFKQFCNENFSGNVEAALECLAKEGYYKEFNLTKNGANLRRIIDSLDTKLANRYMYYYKIEYQRNPQIYNELRKIEKSLGKMRMTESEIIAAEVNPYKAKAAKSLLAFVLSATGLTAVMVGAKETGLEGGLVTTIESMITMFGAKYVIDIGANISNYFRFKKAKNFIMETNKKYGLLEEEKEEGKGGVKL